MRIERTHDKLYINEKKRNKEYFKQLYVMIENDFKNNCEYSVLDIGCATGDFLFYAKENLSNASVYGIEYMKELIECVDFDVDIQYGDILDEGTLPKRKFECITMLGVLSIFDDFRKPLKNAINMLNDNGVLYVFGIFNPENIDVIIKSKKSEIPFEDPVWESGWNLFSQESIRKYIEGLGCKCSFIPFEIDIEKNDADPLRTWTEKMEKGYMIINGLQLRHTFYFCRITK